MLMAVLYCEENEIAAAGPACDQMPYGDRYWEEIYPGTIRSGSVFETAYVQINDWALCQTLMRLGIDNNVNGVELAHRIAERSRPSCLSKAA